MPDGTTPLSDSRLPGGGRCHHPTAAPPPFFVKNNYVWAYTWWGHYRAW